MRSITLGLVFALATAGAAWAEPAATPVTGRVISIESGIVTVETNRALGAEPFEVKVGDRVRIEAISPAPTRYAPRSKRLLVGLSGLAFVGTLVFFRIRRPITI
jgi:hypothetical protein